MTVTFYKIYDDRHVVTKTLDNTTKIKEKTCTLKSECSILEPELELAYDGDLLAANYMYIPVFNRCYFLRPPVLGAQRMRFTGEVDPLTSWDSDIRKLQCVVERQENKYNCNMKLDDPDFKVYNYKISTTREFPNYVDKSHGALILATGGIQ